MNNKKNAFCSLNCCSGGEAPLFPTGRERGAIVFYGGLRPFCTLPGGPVIALSSRTKSTAEFAINKGNESQDNTGAGRESLH